MLHIKVDVKAYRKQKNCFKNIFGGYKYFSVHKVHHFATGKTHKYIFLDITEDDFLQSCYEDVHNIICSISSTLHDYLEIIWKKERLSVLSEHLFFMLLQ